MTQGRLNRGQILEPAIQGGPPPRTATCRSTSPAANTAQERTPDRFWSGTLPDENPSSNPGGALDHGIHWFNHLGSLDGDLSKAPPQGFAVINITDDLRISGLRAVIPPAILIDELAPQKGYEGVAKKRTEIEAILEGRDSRLLAVVGPCSIHDANAAREYAQKLSELTHRYADELLVIMRCYFEKPRTTVGWKGLINDPDLDGSYHINKGLRLARSLLCDVVDLDLGVACEFLDPISPQFIADLVSWGAIGARTSESQVHREMASGLSMPVGFKNGTNGNIQIAIDGVRAASHPHQFLAVTKQGLAAIIHTKGNPSAHIILRGGQGQPNYGSQAVSAAVEQIKASKLSPQLVIDCSHANSDKDHAKQPMVAQAIAEQLAGGQSAIRGVMIESFLKAGRQNLQDGKAATYGQSITDACVDLATTESMLQNLALGVNNRRKKAA